MELNNKIKDLLEDMLIQPGYDKNNNLVDSAIITIIYNIAKFNDIVSQSDVLKAVLEIYGRSSYGIAEDLPDEFVKSTVGFDAKFMDDKHTKKQYLERKNEYDQIFVEIKKYVESKQDDYIAHVY